MWASGKLYDLIAGRRRTVPPSHIIPPSQALYEFPALRRADGGGRSLKGGLVLYDGQHNDCRMNLHIVLTAVQHGACAVNHCRLDALLMEGAGEGAGEADSLVAGAGAPLPPQVRGAVVVDTLTGRRVEVRARQVINAAGVFSDGVRHMADPAAPDIMVAGPGSHLVLPDYASPANMGLVWFTRDGRVLYLLPWEGSTIAGTTDRAGEVTFEPVASREEVAFILGECNRVLRDPVTPATVRAAWCGLRPLVRDPAAAPGDTKAISRDHVVEVLPCGLLTIAGGKWTTYRRMAQDAVDRAVAVNPALAQRVQGPCVTQQTRLIGADRGGLVCHRNFDQVAIALRET